MRSRIQCHDPKKGQPVELLSKLTFDSGGKIQYCSPRKDPPKNVLKNNKAYLQSSYT